MNIRLVLLLLLTGAREDKGMKTIVTEQVLQNLDTADFIANLQLGHGTCRLHKLKQFCLPRL